MSGTLIRVVAGPSLGDMATVDRPLTVGHEAELTLADPTVSRTHARLEPTSGGVAVTDLGSSSGTFVDDRPARDATVARPGSVIEVGGTRLAVLRLERFHDAAGGPALRIGEGAGARVVEIRDGMVLGRDADCDVQLDDPSVSRRHARLRIDGSTLVLEDLASANGSSVDGRPVPGRTRLADGTTVRLGRAAVPLVVLHGPATGPTVAVRVRREGDRRIETLIVEARPAATVAEVTADLAAAVGATGDQLLLYRSEDGLLLHPDDRWAATGIRRGDELVVGAGDASSVPASGPPGWPERRGTRLNQLPRTVWPPSTHQLPRVDPPESSSLRGRGLVWQIIGGLGAVGVGLVLAIVKPEYAVFGLITGGIGIISIGASILGDQSRRRHKVGRFRQRLAALDAELTATRHEQARARARLAPDAQELASWLAEESPRIWERRPADDDALRLTLGEGTVATLFEVDRPGSTDSPLVGELDAVVERHRRIEGAPVRGPGPADGSLGIAGPAERVAPFLAGAIVEAAVQLPPEQLRIWVAASDPSWSWVQWLPHVRPEAWSADPASAGEVVAALRSDLAERRPSGAPPALLHLLVVPDPLDRVDDASLASELRGRGLLLAAAHHRRELPPGLAVTVEVDRAGEGTVAGAYDDAPLSSVRLRGTDPGAAEAAAVALGRLDRGAAGTGPDGLVALLGLGDVEHVDVAAAWARPREALSVAVGVDDGGEPVTVGFRADGPHGMIAGTTGSGKSELLQTLLAGLALTHPPEQLAMFLIDFKGGATFAPLAALPHVVGSVTDLESDSSLARRAFAALDAEIARRKRLLDAARVPNVIDYERLPEVEPLPNLLVVIDEFALLVERQPEVKDRLDTVATQGRSLGIHLMLATQSPSGVVTHAIRTNTNLWICLRVVADSESVELLGTRTAARIPDRSPGRAIVRLGAGEDLRPFQAARIGRPLARERGPVTVRRADGSPVRATGGPAVAGPGTTELDVVVARIAAAHATRDVPALRPLWLPPLPRHLPASSLPPRAPDHAATTPRLVARLGLVDLPDEQAQRPFDLDLTAAGNAMLVGVLGSGRSTALLQLGTDLAGTWAPADLHLHGIDAGTGSLAPLAALPHTGAIVGATDVERLARLLDRLAAEVDARRDRLAASGMGDFDAWRAAGGTDPHVVVLIDDYPAFREVAERVESGRLLDRCNSLLQNGPAVGMHLVLVANQSVDLRLRETSLIPLRLVFRAPDASDYALVETRVRPGEVPDLPPGRALAVGGVEVQVALPDLDAVGDLAARWGGADAPGRPRGVERLPTAIDRADLGSTPDPGSVLVGVGGDDVSPIAVDLGRGSPVLVVAGPIQSGRSTTLATLLAGHRAAHPGGRCLVVAPRPSPLRDLPEDELTMVASTADRVIAGLDAIGGTPNPGDVVVIDDAESLSSIPGAGERLEAILRTAVERRTTVFAGFRVNDLPGLFDSWARYLISLRRAVLLQPVADDAFLFGAKLPVIPPPVVPGRGVLVEGQAVTVVQVARAAPDGAPT